jgi:GNAT superfamily N-acetyltransferase
MPVTIRTTDVPDDAVRAAIVNPLAAYNRARAGRYDVRPVIVTIEEDGAVVGGLWGRTAYDWLFVELLFVPEGLRRQGLGAALMTAAEDEARSRGCHSAWLDTFEFQARGFYERLGYTCFGELPKFPAGYSRYFMRKALIEEREEGSCP